MTVELEGQGPGQARASFASSVSTALTESNRPTFFSSQGLFLSSASVNQHISHAKVCRNAKMGYREMPIQVRAVDHGVSIPELKMSTNSL